jgi:hypothetical protein
MQLKIDDESIWIEKNCSKFEKNSKKKFVRNSIKVRKKNTLKVLVLEHTWLFNDCLKYKKVCQSEKTTIF